METNNRKIILYIAMSLDGYIAAPGDNLDFLSVVEKEGEDYGYHRFVETVDTVIMGRKTYDKVLSFGIPFPHSDKQSFIITSKSRPSEGNIHFYTGNLKDLVNKLKSEPGKHVFVDGGAAVVQAMLKEQLLDELVISVIPVLLGDGIPLFQPGSPTTDLQLVGTKSFEKGLVQLHYQRA